MKVRELMTVEVRTCRDDGTAADAAEVMWSHDVGVVPVIDAAGTVVGMVTDRDVAMAALHAGGPLTRIRVTDAMSRTVRTCRPDDNVPRATEIMGEARVRRLPVVDERGHLVGLLSMNDVARAAAEGGSASLAKAVATTLGAIGTRRLSLPPLRAM